MKRRKYAALFLCLVFIVASFSGCKKGSESKNASKDIDSKISSSNTSSAEETSSENSSGTENIPLAETLQQDNQNEQKKLSNAINNAPIQEPAPRIPQLTDTDLPSIDLPESQVIKNEFYNALKCMTEAEKMDLNVKLTTETDYTFTDEFSLKFDYSDKSNVKYEYISPLIDGDITKKYTDGWYYQTYSEGQYKDQFEISSDVFPLLERYTHADCSEFTFQGSPYVTDQYITNIARYQDTDDNTIYILKVDPMVLSDSFRNTHGSPTNYSTWAYPPTEGIDFAQKYVFDKTGIIKSIEVFVKGKTLTLDEIYTTNICITVNSVNQDVNILKPENYSDFPMYSEYEQERIRKLQNNQ